MQKPKLLIKLIMDNNGKEEWFYSKELAIDLDKWAISFKLYLFSKNKKL